LSSPLTRLHTRAPSYYALVSTRYSSAAYGRFPDYGSGALVGTSIGLNRSLASILREIQTAADPSNTSSKSTTWLPSHWQPCAPWSSANSNPAQAATQLGYGRSWVACSEWDGTRDASTVWNGVQTLSLSRAGLNGTIAASALCELNATLQLADFSQNALTGTRTSA
jgi:hypothetical protein